jgi:hypothetical protein
LDTPGVVIALQLLVWSVAWMGAGVLGLWAARSEFWRGFWLVAGIWCAVNAAIGVAGLFGPPAAPADLRRLLLVNVWLDVVYVGVGAILLSRRRPTVRGSGLAVLIQGAFLLVFDGLHALRLPGA